MTSLLFTNGQALETCSSRCLKPYLYSCLWLPTFISSYRALFPSGTRILRVQLLIRLSLDMLYKSLPDEPRLRAFKLAPENQ